MMKKRILIASLIILFSYASVFCLEEGWHERKSTHFLIYYKDAPDDFVEEVLDAAEDYYQKITRELGFTRYKYWLWDDRAKIYIYEDADDYHSTTGKPKWASGHAVYQFKTIFTYPLASGFFDTLLPHELGHIIFREFVGFKNSNVPLWLDEGVATYQEKSKRWGADKLVKKAIKAEKFIPLDELTKINNLIPLEKDKVDLFYNESVSVVYFLISKHGRYNFMTFCRALRDGKSLDRAIDYAYTRFNDLDDLNKVWYRYLTKR
ncbi:MAG: peptidase MA family metallohydrolase [Candidatus Omnitrophota bacterium]